MIEFTFEPRFCDDVDTYVAESHEHLSAYLAEWFTPEPDEDTCPAGIVVSEILYNDDGKVFMNLYGQDRHIGNVKEISNV